MVGYLIWVQDRAGSSPVISTNRKKSWSLSISIYSYIVYGSTLPALAN